MIVLANCIALFVSGVAFGAAIEHWYSAGGNAWGSISVSLLIAVIAAENLRKAFVRLRQPLRDAEDSAV